MSATGPGSTWAALMFLQAGTIELVIFPSGMPPKEGTGR